VSALEAIDPLPRTRRGWIALAVLGVVFVTAFVLVIRFYNVEGGSRVSGGADMSTQDGLVVAVQPVSVDATREVSRVHFTFGHQGAGLVGSDGRLTRNLRVTVTTGQGIEEFTFPAGTVVGQAETEVALDGEEATYPFDQHKGIFSVSADTYETKADGSVASVGAIPVGLTGSGGVNGWDTSLDLSDGLSDRGIAAITFDRAFSTQVFAMLILAIAGILAILALIVGLLVQSGRRPSEATLLSWSAALLFALPALRNYLPNGPPLGASIDMYAYLWFMVAAGFAAVLLIIGWNVQRQHELKVARDRRDAMGDAHAT